MSKKNEKITITITNNSVGYVSKISEKGFEEISGEGEGIITSIENLALNMRLSLEKDEQGEVLAYITHKMPEARKIALSFWEVVGVEVMMVNQISKLTGEHKDLVEHKLDFISNFGFSKSVDNTSGGGKRWQICMKDDDLIIHYMNQAGKFQATVNYFNNLAENLRKIKLEELQPKQEQADENR